MREIDEKGAYYISRLRSQTKVFKKKGGKWEEVDLVKMGETLRKNETMEIHDAYLGHQKIYVPRLMVYRLTDEQLQNRLKKQERTKKKKGVALTSNTLEKNSYNFIITNIPYEEFTSQEAYDMYSLRWQIEILFKTWKSIYQVNEVKKVKVERFECHLYSTLIGILIASSLTFQVRTYLQQKKNKEVSEYKAMGLIRDYLPRILKDEEKRENHGVILLEIIEKNGIKSRRGNKQTSGTILKESGVI